MATNPNQFYRRISLELSSTWPGHVYLRFEPYDREGGAIMIQVLPGDMVNIAKLADINHEMEPPDPDPPRRSRAVYGIRPHMEMTEQELADAKRYAELLTEHPPTFSPLYRGEPEFDDDPQPGDSA